MSGENSGGKKKFGVVHVAGSFVLGLLTGGGGTVFGLEATHRLRTPEETAAAQAKAKAEAK